jgi:predicted TIM-barrel fold metal-dependent hydrolase
VPYTLVSSDSHINEPPDLWTKAAPASKSELVPKVVSLASGDDAWILGPDAGPRMLATSAAAGTKPEDYMKEPVTYREMRPGSFDPHARLEDMDIDSIDAEVLYPGIGRALHSFHDADTRLFCAQVYNDWIAEFQAADPARFVGLAVLPPIDDGDHARQELERVADLGIKGAMLTRREGGRPLSHPAGEDLWSLAEERRIPISLHVGSGVNTLADPSDAKLPGVKEAFLSITPMGIAEHMAVLIFGGVLERHPGLRIVIAESGIGWMPGFFSRMESVYDRHRHYLHSQTSRRPTEVFQQQFYATFQEDVPGLRLRDILGMGSLMWASDYPHTDTTWPESVATVKRDFVDVGAEDKERILWQNCVDLYHFPS